MNTKSACYKDLRVQVNTSYCNPRSRPATGLMPCNTQPCPSRSDLMFFFFLCHCCVCYNSSNGWYLVISFYHRITRDNLWFQNFMNDPINISTLYVLLALNPDIIKNRLKCVQTFPHIFLIHTFGWKKTEYLLLLDFPTSGYVSYSVVQSTFPGRAIKRPVGYVTARNIVGCHSSAFCTCMFMSGTWGDRWSGSGAVSQIGWCSCTSSTC